MQIVSNMALISINETMVVQLVSFLIFLFVINRLMFRPLRNTMAERDFQIEKIKSEIEDAEKKCDDTLIEFKERESAIRDQAYRLSKEHEDAGNQEAETIFSTTRDEIAALKKEADAELNAKIQEARKAVGAESETLALAIVQSVLERRPSR